MGLVEVLDETAGEWPVDLAAELAGIARRCLDDGGRLERDSLMVTVFKEIEQVRKKADDLVAARECEVSTREGVYMEEDTRNVPEVFLCPIFQVTIYLHLLFYLQLSKHKLKLRHGRVYGHLPIEKSYI